MLSCLVAPPSRSSDHAIRAFSSAGASTGLMVWLAEVWAVRRSLHSPEDVDSVRRGEAMFRADRTRLNSSTPRSVARSRRNARVPRLVLRPPNRGASPAWFQAARAVQAREASSTETPLRAACSTPAQLADCPRCPPTNRVETLARAIPATCNAAAGSWREVYRTPRPRRARPLPCR